METRASYLLVGSFVLGTVAVALAAVIWLARSDFSDRPKRYAVYFGGSVTGLAIGSPVRFRGVPVGNVAEIRIDPTNLERIKVTLDIKRGTPIRKDTVATLGMQGITGIAYIQLEGGTQGAEELTALPGQKLPVIRSRASGIEQVLKNAPALFETAISVADRLMLLVNDENLRSVAESLRNIRAVSEILAKRSDNVGYILSEGSEAVTALRDASRNFDRLSQNLAGRSGRLLDDTGSALKEFRKTAKAFGQVAERLNKVVGENSRPLRDFSGTGLYELSLFISEARVLVTNLTRLTAQIERDPSRFFFGDNQKGYEPK